MKKFLTSILGILLMLPAFVGAFDVPAKPSTYVNDYAGMLSIEERAQLEQKLQAFERSSTNEIAVVTVQSLNGEDVADVAQQIFTAWGIGKKEKNNGVLLLISLSDRKTRIQTGYGVEGSLTDLGTSYIQSGLITPAFRAGNYAQGINDAVDAMIRALGGENIVPSYEFVSDSKDSTTSASDTFVIIILVVGNLFLWFFAATKSWWLGGVVGAIIAAVGVFFLGLPVLIFIPTILAGLLFDFVLSKIGVKGAGGGGFGGFSGGGSSFGGGSSGGGFGGGFSGGGGSSGSW